MDDNRKIVRDPIDISTEQWAELIQDNNIFKSEDIALIATLFHCENSREKASELAKLMGLSSYAVLNGQIGRLGKRIMQRFPEIQYSKRENGTIRFWHIPFWGEEAEKKGQFYWQLRPELKDVVKNYLNNSDQFSVESQETAFIAQELSREEASNLFEGAKKKITVNVYERNVRARQQCIARYGYICCVCDFNFEQFYGDIGKGFIEVHHLTPLSEINEEYQVDPTNDLRPVCPNCHAMIHRANLSIEELRSIVKRRGFIE